MYSTRAVKYCATVAYCKLLNWSLAQLKVLGLFLELTVDINFRLHRHLQLSLF